MEEDSSDFNPLPSTSSNLASLFGYTSKPLQGNSSLTYTAPKAPKGELSSAKKKSEEKTKRKIIFSRAVQAYKLENRTYFNQGLMGIVISGDHNSKIYEVILYTKTKEHVCQIRISNNFSITLCANNYASFYDSNLENWSVMFQSAADIDQFSQKVAVCKFYSKSNSSKEILIQDLEPALNQKADLNSVVEVDYKCFSLCPEEVFKLEGEFKEKIKLSEYSYQYLSKGLVGCAENCKRLIIIPHSLAGPWLNELAPNEDLLIEAKVEKIVSEVENVMPESSFLGDRPFESLFQLSTEETSVKAKGASIKEALYSTKSHKANLISRMAQMGQATIPIKQSWSGGHSISEEESTVMSSLSPLSLRSKYSVTGSPVNYSLSQNQNPETLKKKIGVAYQQPMPASATSISSSKPVYVSEPRIQVAELRMDISKMSDKLDLVWNSIQNINLIGRKAPEQASIDEEEILRAVKRVIDENKSLKEKVGHLEKVIEQQEHRISHLLELNSKYSEQNTTFNEKQSVNESKLKMEMESLQIKELEVEAAKKMALDRLKNVDDFSKSEKLNKELKKKDLNYETEALKKNLEGNNETTKEFESGLKENIAEASESIIKSNEKLREAIDENEYYKCVIEAQTEEIRTESQDVENLSEKKGVRKDG